jgi:hypothetical protein
MDDDEKKYDRKLWLGIVWFLEFALAIIFLCVAAAYPRLLIVPILICALCPLPLVCILNDDEHFERKSYTDSDEDEDDWR